ncbi:hypothetical protein GS876_08055 [Rhodococcus hoagii]|nr:hypothetical protein [Prescottella equi]
MSTPESGRAVAMAPATSPSEISRMRAPVSRISRMMSACRGRSRIVTVVSDTARFLAFATRRMFSATPAARSMTSAASGPTAILSM